MTRPGRLSSILRRPFAGASTRLARRDAFADAGPATAEEAAAYEAEVRQAFLSPTGLEPAIGGRRTAPAPEPAREPAVDKPVAEPGMPEPRPTLRAAAAPPVANAPGTDPLQADTPVSRPALAATPLPAPMPKTMAPSSGPPASPPGGAPANVGEVPRARASSPGTRSRPRARVWIPAAILLVLVVSIVATIGGALVLGGAVAPRTAEPVGTPNADPSAAATHAATLPDGVTAGFLQVAAVNDRLARAASSLTAALAVKLPSAAEIAPVLRKIAADARSGQEGSARIGAWPAAGAYPADLAAFYKAAAAVAAEGLGAPLTDNAAYATAGRRMLAALEPLPAFAAATREAAARAGVALPDAVETPRVSSSPEG